MQMGPINGMDQIMSMQILIGCINRPLEPLDGFKEQAERARKFVSCKDL